MSDQTIGAGPGNNVAITKTRLYKCGGTIAKGNPVGFSDATAVAALVVTYGAGSFIDGATIGAADLDANDPTLGTACGVATEAGVVGDWITVVVGGFCDYVVTDESVEEGDVLILTAAAGVCGGTAGETGDLLGFGIALTADSTAVLTKAMIFDRF